MLERPALGGLGAGRGHGLVGRRDGAFHHVSPASVGQPHRVAVERHARAERQPQALVADAHGGAVAPRDRLRTPGIGLRVRHLGAIAGVDPPLVAVESGAHLPPVAGALEHARGLTEDELAHLLGRGGSAPP